MIKNRLIYEQDSSRLDGARTLIILHAITAMHGTEFDRGDGIGGSLQAGFENRYGNLEITTALHLSGYSKSVSLKIGMFWTDLTGKDHVCEKLLDRPGLWDFPIEIQNNRLCPIGAAPAAMPRDPDTAVIDFPPLKRRGALGSYLQILTLSILGIITGGGSVDRGGAMKLIAVAIANKIIPLRIMSIAADASFARIKL